MNRSGGSVVYERFNKRERKKLKQAVTAMRKRLGIRHYGEIDGMAGGMHNGDPAKERIQELADFFAYATFTRHESEDRKHDRRDLIKEKYFGLDGNYYTAGNALR